jgi:hypothetical protein
MSKVLFGSLNVGDVFMYNNKEYLKTPKTKISCCKFHNCKEVGVGTNIGLRDQQEVETKEETKEEN